MFSLPLECHTIEEGAFEGCINLQNFNIPLKSNLQNIGIFAFRSTQLFNFTITSQLKEIREGSFSFISSQFKLAWDDESNVKIIWERAFSESQMTSFYVPKKYSFN